MGRGKVIARVRGTVRGRVSSRGVRGRPRCEGKV